MAVSRINAWAKDEDIAGGPTLTVAAGGNRIVVAFCTVEHNGSGGRPDTDEIELPDGADSGQIHPTLELGDTALTYAFGETTGYPHTYSNALCVFYLLESDIASLSGGEAFSISYDFTEASGSSFPYGGDAVKIHYAAYENVDQTDPFRDDTGGFEGTFGRILSQDVPDTDTLENEQWLLFCSGDKHDVEFSIEDVSATFAAEWDEVSTLNDGSSPATTHESSYVFERDNTSASTDEWDDITVDSTGSTRLGVFSLVLQNEDAVSDLELTIIGNASASGAVDLEVFQTPSIIGNASASGSVSLSFSLAPSIIGNASASGAVDLEVAQTPSIIGNASASGSVDLEVSLAPSIIGNTSASGSVDLEVSLTPSILGNASASGAVTLSTTSEVSPSIIGNASAAGAVDLEVSLTPSIIGNASASGSVDLEVTQAPSIIGNASASGSVDLEVSRLFSVSGNTSASGSVTLERSVVLTVIGTAGASGSVDVEVTRLLSIIGNTSASGSVNFAAVFVETADSTWALKKENDWILAGDESDTWGLREQAQWELEKDA